MPNQDDATKAVTAMERAGLLLACLSEGELATRLRDVLGIVVVPSDCEAVENVVSRASLCQSTDEIVDLVREALDFERDPAAHNGEDFCQLVAEKRGTPEVYCLLLAVALLSCGHDSAMISNATSSSSLPLCWVEAPSPNCSGRGGDALDIWSSIAEHSEDDDDVVKLLHGTLDIRLGFVLA